MIIQVHLFGYLAEAHGPVVTVEVPADRASVAAARAALASRDQRFSDTRVRAVIDDVVVGDAVIIGPGQRLEFLPPLSGG